MRLVLALAICVALIGRCNQLWAEESDPFAAVPEALRAFHKTATAGDECDYVHRLGDMIASAYDVGHGWKLYFVPCILGAYQGHYAVYAAKADDTEISRLLFVTWDENIPGLAATGLVAEAEYKPKTRVLSSYEISRGLGDCGTSAEYEVIADDLGVRTQVLEIRDKENCDGKYTKFPKVFPPH